jgi:catechol 2,3-dioxygenase-like lactoylglutathione lyase family enzyme
MKMTSISGIVSYVKNTKKTAEFYETLGFMVSRRDQDLVSVRLNWFWLDFLPQDKEDKPNFKEEAALENKGAGQFLYIKVENVDAFYEVVLAKKLKPSSVPRNWPWGNREFVIRDPDGYKLVFFQKL